MDSLRWEATRRLGEMANAGTFGVAAATNARPLLPRSILYPFFSSDLARGENRDGTEAFAQGSSL